MIADGAWISAVNLAEVVTRLVDQGYDEEEAHEDLASFVLEVVPFDEELAYRAGLLRTVTRPAGLSLGDRACLALAERLDLPALTADRSWATLQLDTRLGIRVEVVR